MYVRVYIYVCIYIYIYIDLHEYVYTCKKREPTVFRPLTVAQVQLSQLGKVRAAEAAAQLLLHGLQVALRGHIFLGHHGKPQFSMVYVGIPSGSS